MQKLKRKDLESYAEKLKLDMKKFKEALDKKLYAKEVDKDLATGNRIKVQGTPTTYVNGRKVDIGRGQKPEEVLGGLVKDELERVKELEAKGLKGDKLYYELVGKPEGSEEGGDKKDKEQKEYEYIAVGDSPSKGDDDAKVTLIEFSDFTCGFCAGAAQSVNQIAKAYKGKVRVVFKNYPLSQGNFDIAQAALAAHQQGKFWEYHDLLFANQKSVDRDSLIGYAKRLDLDVELFKQTMDAPSTKAQVEADAKQGRALKLQGTPSFFLNNRPLGAMQGFEAFMKELNKELIAKGFKKADLPSGPPPVEISMQEVAYLGAENAPVTIVEYSDFECPYCSRAGRMVKQFTKSYKDKVKLVFKHFPLSFHKDAHLAHQASLEALEQGGMDKFWAYHDKLFENQSKLKRESLIQYAQEMGLNVEQFTKALDSQKHKSRVDRDLQEGGQVGVQGTPTVFINGVKAEGYEFDKLKKQIDPILIKLGHKASDLPEKPTVHIALTNVASMGSEKAPVTIVEYSDFECPYCSRAGRLLKQFAKAYKDKVRFVFKHYPLSFHKDAHLAHQAAIEAYEQGKFWEYHDLLFANQRQLKRHHLESYARQVGLDLEKLRKALDTQKHRSRVDADISEGTGVGVQGTPSAFINGQSVGAFEFDKLKAVVDPILIKKGYKAEDLPTGQRYDIKVGKSHFKGDRRAPITIAEYSEFECPFCSIAARQVPQVVKMYPGLVKVAFKHFPLSFHKNAHLASQASLAAGEQGKFWEYHDLLFANQQKLKRDDLVGYAQKLGLNVERFKQVLDAGIFKEDVDHDMKEGQEVGVQGTPSFYVNGVPVAAGASLKNMATAIEKELRRLKLKSPVSAAELKKLGVELDSPKPKVLPPSPTVPRVIIAPGTKPAAQPNAKGQCKPGTGGTQCIPPAR